MKKGILLTPVQMELMHLKSIEKRYEVILLDENMPGLNGIGTLKQIKKLTETLRLS